MKALKYVCWDPPPSNWLKLNSDGSVKLHNAATCGGVTRDYSGHAIRSFAAKLGSCPMTVAELCGAYHALNIAWTLGHQHIILELDSNSAIALM